MQARQPDADSVVTNDGARSLKMINAYALAADGTPLGLLGKSGGDGKPAGSDETAFSANVWQRGHSFVGRNAIDAFPRSSSPTGSKLAKPSIRGAGW